MNKKFDYQLADTISQDKSLKSLHSFIENGGDIFGSNGYFLKPAIKNDNLDLVKYLIKAGVKDTSLPHSPLLQASSLGKLSIVKHCIEEEKMNIHAKTDYALRYAVQGGHFDVVEYLVSKGAEVNIHDGYLLVIAANEGYTDIINLLVKHNINIAKNTDALKYSTINGHIDTVKYLITNCNMDIEIVLNNAISAELKNWAVDYKNIKNLYDNLDTNLHTKEYKKSGPKKI